MSMGMGSNKVESLRKKSGKPDMVGRVGPESRVSVGEI